MQRAQDDEISTACLADVIRTWVWSGEGVRVCHGDYQTFLVAVIAIINDWHTHEDLLDYHDRSDEKPGLTERRTSKIFDPEDDLYYDVILDRTGSRRAPSARCIPI